MLKKIAVAFCAVVLLSGCSSSSKKHGMSADAAHLQQLGDKVYFAYDSSTLSQEAKATLERQAKFLHEKSLTVMVEGHCDERGTREYNIALGERRAEAVKKFLASHGVDSAHVETISYGKEKPAVVGNDEAAFSKNRRGVTAIK